MVAIVDRNVNVISPYTTAAGNRNESPLFSSALSSLKSIAKAVWISISGSLMSLDGAYDSTKNRKLIFNSGMIPNINENKRNRKKTNAARNVCLILPYLKSDLKRLNGCSHGKINLNDCYFVSREKAKIILV